VPNTTLFDETAERLESATSLDRLEARGTLRIALKQAGFDPKHVRAGELVVLMERVLARELTARGIEDADSVVERLVASLPAADDSGLTESPESVFRRLGGDG